MKAKMLRMIYPSIVGVLLGLLQTGLFFQLSFTLSSSFGTFLMVTLSWLIGSAVGVKAAKSLSPQWVLALSLAAYFCCGLLVAAAPFNTEFWIVYAGLIMLTGIYPGVFFVRMGELYPARSLFFMENNGFIVGLVIGTILFMLIGRIILWIAPVALAQVILMMHGVVVAQPRQLEAGG